MSVEKMKFATVSGDFDKLDKVLELCVESENFQIENAAEYMSSLKSYQKIVEENEYSGTLESLTNLAQTFGFELEYKKPDSVWENVEQSVRKVDEIVKEISDLSAEKTELEKKIVECDARIQQFIHLDKLDVPVDDVFNCEYVAARFGRMPVNSYQVLPNFCKRVNVFFYLLAKDHNSVWGMYFVPQRDKEEADRVFASLFFERITVPDSSATPHEAVEQLKKERAESQSRLNEIDKRIKSVFFDSDDIQMVYSVLLKRSRLYDFRRYAVKYGNDFVIVGFIPKKSRKEFVEILESVESVSVGYTETKNVNGITTPTKLKNNPVVRPFEFYIKMFGVPKYGEMDPTFFVAVTYTILYGIMFADLGQGLVLSVVGYLMYKLKNMDLGKLLIPCGISGAFFGLVFGSVFGFEHTLDPMYKSLFGLNEKPIEVMDGENMIYILLAAVGIGVFLVIIAMILNIYSCLKQKNLGGALFGTNGVCGLMIYSGILLIALNLLVGLGINTTLIVWVMIVVPVVLLWLSEPLIKLVNGDENWKPESWGEYLAQGFFEVFESLISYLTNTVSFLRVGAFVLVHASMMQVFFSLAEMAGTGSIVYYVIIIFGNVFVLVLEGLLVGVQSLRLEFYEMFNRFFEGSGKEFTPMKY